MLISLAFWYFVFPETIAENGFGEMDRVFGRFLGISGKMQKARKRRFLCEEERIQGTGKKASNR